MGSSLKVSELTCTRLTTGIKLITKTCITTCGSVVSMRQRFSSDKEYPSPGPANASQIVSSLETDICNLCSAETQHQICNITWPFMLCSRYIFRGSVAQIKDEMLLCLMKQTPAMLSRFKCVNYIVGEYQYILSPTLTPTKTEVQAALGNLVKTAKPKHMIMGADPSPPPFLCKWLFWFLLLYVKQCAIFFLLNLLPLTLTASSVFAAVTVCKTTCCLLFSTYIISFHCFTLLHLSI